MKNVHPVLALGLERTTFLLLHLATLFDFAVYLKDIKEFVKESTSKIQLKGGLIRNLTKE